MRHGDRTCMTKNKHTGFFILSPSTERIFEPVFLNPDPTALDTAPSAPVLPSSGYGSAIEGARKGCLGCSVASSSSEAFLET